MTVIDRSPNIFRLFSQLRQFARLSIGRMTGTTPNTNGRYLWLIDNQERSLFMRAELNALVALLIEKGCFTEDEWKKAVEAEATRYVNDQRSQWPEVTALAEDGRSVTVDAQKLRARMQKEEWPP